MTLQEIWQLAGTLEDRLKLRMPGWQPFPGFFELRGVSKIVPADFKAPAPDAETVAFILQRLLDAACEVLDFEAQSEILDLLGAVDPMLPDPGR